MFNNIFKIATQGIANVAKQNLVAVLVDDNGQVLDAVWDGIDDGIIIITDCLNKYILILAEMLKDV